MRTKAQITAKRREILAEIADATDNNGLAELLANDDTLDLTDLEVMAALAWGRADDACGIAAL